jgi:hypothetical protein
MPAMSTERSPEPARPLTLRAILFSAAGAVEGAAPPILT